MEIIRELVNGMNKKELVAKFNQLGTKAYLVNNMDDAINIVYDIPKEKRDDFLANMIFNYLCNNDAEIYFLDSELSGHCNCGDDFVYADLENLLAEKLKKKISDWLIEQNTEK